MTLATLISSTVGLIAALIIIYLIIKMMNDARKDGQKLTDQLIVSNAEVASVKLQLLTVTGERDKLAVAIEETKALYGREVTARRKVQDEFESFVRSAADSMGSSTISDKLRAEFERLSKMSSVSASGGTEGNSSTR